MVVFSYREVNIVQQLNKKRVTTYLLITFSITYAFWWGLAVLTNLNIVNSSQGIFTLLHVIGGFGPTIAAIAVLPKKSPKEILRFVFSCKKNSFWYLLLFCAIQGSIVGLSSMERHPAMSWYAAPIVLLSATVVGGGNEELGWRGILQPELERKFPYPVATVITGCIWMIWHIPLWFVVGASQQNIHYGLYCIYGLILSFWLAAIYKKTNSVFFCVVFHGFANLLLSFFVIKVNWILVIGLLLSLVFSIWLCRKKESPGHINCRE